MSGNSYGTEFKLHSPRLHFLPESFVTLCAHGDWEILSSQLSREAQRSVIQGIRAPKNHYYQSISDKPFYLYAFANIVPFVQGMYFTRQ